MLTKDNRRIRYSEHSYTGRLPRLTHGRYFDLANKRVKIIHSNDPVTTHLGLISQSFAETLQIEEIL